MKIILKKPLITEKANMLTDKLKKLTFVVEKTATKDQIKSSIEKLYNVEVTSVNTMRYAGKLKAKNTKKGMMIGRRDAFKKAVVSLKDGDTIDFYENV